jgi:hypothetical protein
MPGLHQAFPHEAGDLGIILDQQDPHIRPCPVFVRKA